MNRHHSILRALHVLIVLIIGWGFSFATTARAQCGGPAPVAGDFRSAGGGSWNTAAIWETFDSADWVAASSVPGAATTTRTSICGGHSVQVPGFTTVTLGGTLVIEPGGAVTSGNSSRLDLEVDAFTNDGALSVTVDFQKIGLQFWGGGGTHTALTSVRPDALVRLSSDVTLDATTSAFVVDAGGILDLDGRTLTVEGHPTSNRLLSNAGTITGGELRLRNRVNLRISAAAGSVFESDLRVLDGITSADTGTTDGDVIVDAAATVSVSISRVLTVNGDATIFGTVSGTHPNARIVVDGSALTNHGAMMIGNVDFGGSSLTNDGSIDGTFLSFDGSGNQTLGGVGSMTSGINVRSGSTTRLVNDIDVGAAAHASTISSGGTLDLNGFTLTYAGMPTANRLVSNAGTVTGGELRLRNRINLRINADAGSIFSSDLRILDGITTVDTGTTMGDLILDTGASVVVPISRVLTVNGYVSVAGTLSGSHPNARFVAGGAAFANAGSVTIGNVDLTGAALALSGAGTWTGGMLRMLASSTTTLASDVTVNTTFLRIEDGATLSLGGHNLTTTAGTTIVGPAGTLAGEGTFDYSAGSLAHTGIISPGASPGILALKGPFSNASGILNIDLDNSPVPGTGHDQLAVDGTVAHGGILNVDLGYVPNLGDEFTILTCTLGCTGAFDTVNLPPDYAADEIYNANETILRITSVPNAFPAVNNPIADQAMNLGGPAKTFNLNNVFIDTDGDVLTYTAVSSDAAVAGATVSGSTLSVTALAAGTTTVTVTADDGKGGTVQDVFDVIVNTPPTVANPIADQNTTAGDPPLIFDLTTIFSDADGDPLTLTANSNNGTVVDASLSGATLTVTSLAPGLATVTVKADDGRGGMAQDAFVVAVNGAPVVVSPIADQTLTLGNPPFSRNLNFVFDDPDGDPLTFTAVTSDGSVAGVSISGSTLTIAQLAAGIATITVTADDGNDGSVQDVFDVTVNTPPAVDNPIADQIITVGDPPLTFDLTTVFSDADGDALTFTALTIDAGVAGASLSGSILTVTPVTPGTAAITVTANDGRGGTAQDAFLVDVNGPPVVVNPIADQLMNVGDTPLAFDLSTVFADDDPLTYSAVSSNAAVSDVNVSGSTLTVSALAPGTTSITVTADDGQGGTAQDVFDVTVNTPPALDNPIADQNTTSGDPPVVFDLNAVFSDADGDELSYSAFSSNGGIAGASVSGETLTVTSMAGGTATITVTADDGRGGAAHDEFTVTVNTRPTVANAISDQTMNLGDAPLTFDLNTVFSDPDGDALTFTAASSDDGIAEANVSGGALTVTAVAAGTAEITVTADDGRGGTAEVTFTVEGFSDTTPPVVTLRADLVVLWPPDHKYHTVALGDFVLSVVDDQDPDVSIDSAVITSVTSDEPENAKKGDGNTLNDMVIASGCQAVALRAERQTNGNGRVYTIHVAAIDASGNVGTAVFQVHVPKSANGKGAVDDGAVYGVEGDCNGGSVASIGIVQEGARSLELALEASIGEVPDAISVKQNYPNPFNPATTIRFGLPEESTVRLVVYDVAGRMVAVLVDGAMNGGWHDVRWDADGLSSGIYFYRLDAGTFSQVRPMILMR